MDNFALLDPDPDPTQSIRIRNTDFTCCSWAAGAAAELLERVQPQQFQPQLTGLG